jgi:hypothetical protein
MGTRKSLKNQIAWHYQQIENFAETGSRLKTDTGTRKKGCHSGKNQKMNIFSRSKILQTVDSG